MTAVSLFSTHLPEEIVARVLGVMGLVSAGFLAFLLFTSNPFDRLLPPAADGRDLNPLLQDPGMVLHPPMLYMGYVGFSVAFAFAVAAFALSLLGTFLVRSGVLTSVHAFAVDPARGVFILALFVLLIGGALVLFAWRTSRIGLGGSFELASRESALLANNVLLAVAAVSVMLGTLYPLVLDALGAGKISVGPPYFEAVFVPLMAPALFLMGVGPLARWKRTSLPELAGLLRWALGVSLAIGLALPFAFGRWSALVGFGLALAVWVASTAFLAWKKRPTHSRAHLGMVVAHLGVAVFVVGVTLVKGYEAEKDLKMKPGDSLELAGYAFLLEDVSAADGPNYRAARARIAVSREGKPVTVLYPEKG